MAAQVPGSSVDTANYLPNNNDNTAATNVASHDFDKVRKSFKFWAIIIGLGITLWLAALENSVLTTAAPFILAEIPMGDNWVWLTNAFFLSSAAFQPLLGQLSNLFGRRPLTLGVVALFILGSGICGGASSSAQLIVGRAVQGIGSGGIGVALDTVVSDLVPLRYRGNYIAVILLIYSIGTTTGALIGGVIVDHISWRWCFWINLPIGGVSLAITFLFLHVHHRRDTHWFDRLKRVDVVGNAILMGGTTSMLIAIAYAGTRYPWGSWHTLVPLLLGFAIILLFGVYESSSYLGLTRFGPLDPVMPPRVFPTVTSVIIGINTFLYTAVVYWAIFFTPIYFQSVKLASATRAGINIIPISLLGVPSAAAAGAVITKWGRYKAIHLVGFALFTIGMGLWTLLDENTPTGEWVGFMFTAPIGAGLLLNTQLPAFQAPVPESDQGTATATWNFIRTMGSVWGVAIPAAIFGNRVDALVAAGAVSSDVAAASLVGGGAYEHATAEFVQSWSSAIVRNEVRHVYRIALQRVFQCAIAFSGFCLILCLFEKDIPLRTELVTEYGLKDDNAASKVDRAASTGVEAEKDARVNSTAAAPETFEIV